MRPHAERGDENVGIKLDEALPASLSPRKPQAGGAACSRLR